MYKVYFSSKYTYKLLYFQNRGTINRFAKDTKKIGALSLLLHSWVPYYLSMASTICMTTHSALKSQKIWTYRVYLFWIMHPTTKLGALSKIDKCLRGNKFFMRRVFPISRMLCDQSSRPMTFHCYYIHRYNTAIFYSDHLYLINKTAGPLLDY